MVAIHHAFRPFYHKIVFISFERSDVRGTDLKTIGATNSSERCFGFIESKALSMKNSRKSQKT
jgi:hypothetical protein